MRTASLGGKRNPSSKFDSSLKTLLVNKGTHTNGVIISKQGRAKGTTKGPASQGEVLTGGRSPVSQKFAGRDPRKCMGSSLGVSVLSLKLLRCQKEKHSGGG